MKVKPEVAIVFSLCSSCRNLIWKRKTYYCKKTNKKIKQDEVVSSCKYWPPVVVYEC